MPTFLSLSLLFGLFGRRLDIRLSHLYTAAMIALSRARWAFLAMGLLLAIPRADASFSSCVRYLFGATVRLPDVSPTMKGHWRAEFERARANRDTSGSTHALLLLMLASQRELGLSPHDRTLLIKIWEWVQPEEPYEEWKFFGSQLFRDSLWAITGSVPRMIHWVLASAADGRAAMDIKSLCGDASRVRKALDLDDTEFLNATLGHVATAADQVVVRRLRNRNSSVAMTFVLNLLLNLTPYHPVAMLQRYLAHESSPEEIRSVLERNDHAIAGKKIAWIQNARDVELPSRGLPIDLKSAVYRDPLSEGASGTQVSTVHTIKELQKALERAKDADLVFLYGLPPDFREEWKRHSWPKLKKGAGLVILSDRPAVSGFWVDFSKALLDEGHSMVLPGRLLPPAVLAEKEMQGTDWFWLASARGGRELLPGTLVVLDPLRWNARLRSERVVFDVFDSRTGAITTIR